MNEILQWVQIATFAIVAAGLGVAFWQLRAMQQQVTAAREASRTENLLTIIDYIHRPEHRASRHALHKMPKKPLEQWTEEERAKAEMACSSWDAVGLILRNTAIPGATEMIVGNWRHSIYSCHELALPLLRELREDRDPAFWDDFEWLAQKALEQHNVIGGKLRPRQ